MRKFLLAVVLASIPICAQIPKSGGGGGGSGQAAYPASFSGVATLTVTHTTHNLGAQIWGACFDNSTPTNSITQTSGYPTVAANGDIVFAWTGNKTGTCLVTSLGSGTQGATGATGAAGSTGATGAAGYTPNFIVASGAPSNGTGNNADMYINSTTGDIYGPKSGGSWGSIAANIKGPQGAQGPPGSGSVVNVGGSAVSNPNFNVTTPTAQTNNVNIGFQVNGSNVSAEFPIGAMPAGTAVGTTDTGSPALTFGTNSISANNPFSATSLAAGSATADATNFPSCIALDQMGAAGSDFGFCLVGSMTTPLTLAPPNANPPANSIMVFPAPTSKTSQWAWVTFGSQFSITSGQLVLAANSLTINGQSIALGSTGNVNPDAAAGSITLNQGNNNPQTGLVLGQYQIPMGQSSGNPLAVTIPSCTTLGFSAGSFNCGTVSSGGYNQQNFDGSHNTVTVPGLGTTTVMTKCWSGGTPNTELVPSGGVVIAGTSPYNVTFTMPTVPTSSAYCYVATVSFPDERPFFFDGAGAVLSGTLSRCRVQTYPGTVTAFYMHNGGDSSSITTGSATVKIQTVAVASFTGSISSTSDITGGGETMSGQAFFPDTTLSSWTSKSIPAGTMVCAVLSGVTNFTTLAVTLAETVQ
jgi:hypothetical protein